MEIEQIKKEFQPLSGEALYLKIMEWGKRLPAFDPAWAMPENRILGCQSLMYLHTQREGDLLHFFASSDALISRGLAALLLAVYSGQTAETILKTPPTFLEELGIVGQLTPGRANGLASLYLRIKEEALFTLNANLNAEKR